MVNSPDMSGLKRVLRGIISNRSPKFRVAVCAILLLTIVLIVVLPEISLRPATLRLAASCLMQLSLAAMAIVSCASPDTCLRRNFVTAANAVLPSCSRICEICVRRC